jgi:hypothetical protein
LVGKCHRDRSCYHHFKHSYCSAVQYRFSPRVQELYEYQYYIRSETVRVRIYCATCIFKWQLSGRSDGWKLKQLRFQLPVRETERDFALSHFVLGFTSDSRLQANMKLELNTFARTKDTMERKALSHTGLPSSYSILTRILSDCKLKLKDVRSNSKLLWY